MSEKIDYTLIRSDRKTISISVTSEGLIVRAPRSARIAEINRILSEKSGWIRKHLKQAEDLSAVKDAMPKLTTAELTLLKKKAATVIPERLRLYAPLIGVSYGRVTIRCQHTRWGSCSSKGDLNFNCLLMLAPIAVLDSVVVHELCHRKYMDHSDLFYAEVLRVFPQYFECHQWLKTNGPFLLAKIE